MSCVLCGTDTTHFKTINEKHYLICPSCKGIQLDNAFLLNKNQEKNRYDNHNDDYTDEGYQNFVKPIVNAVTSIFSQNDLGLDYGCGKSAIVRRLLNYQNYNCIGYDPFYFPDFTFKNHRYQYITCCEVVEHFYKPSQDFQLLYDLLLEGGRLFVKTNLYNNTINFDQWWYKNDATHVFFYQKETFEYILKAYGFKQIIFHKNYIELIK